MRTLQRLHAAHLALLGRQRLLERQQARVAERLAVIDARLTAIDRGLVNLAAESFPVAPARREAAARDRALQCTRFVTEPADRHRA
jgi:hypothetical protein